MCGILFLEGQYRNNDVLKLAQRLHHRGPDNQHATILKTHSFGFARLSIMDLSDKGNQPFVDERGWASITNGEIYNFHQLRDELKAKGYVFHSDSDCEVLLPLFEETPDLKVFFNRLDAEFATVLYNADTDTIIAGRDPIGIRPLFYGMQNNGNGIAFASEAKVLIDMCTDVKPFPPGHYYVDGEFIEYCDVTKVDTYVKDDIEVVTAEIRRLLEEGIKKRLDSDAPLGFLLSGGLDSSLVCAVAQREQATPIKTYAIGMETDAIDLKYAKETAEYIGSEHTEIIITKEDVINAIPKVVRALESFDITTNRASIGMYLICEAIHRQTDLKVLLTGEVSDELFGYKYTDFAPDAESFQQDAAKRIKELYMYDVLRADRCLAAHSLEARVPFSDIAFMKYVMSIDPAMKMNTYGKGKYLLRKAFDGTGLLPESILWREKAAFSDAVGHSMVDYIKEYAEAKYTDADLQTAQVKYAYHKPPYTKESLLYRELFEEHYQGYATWIKDFWLPNQEWVGKDVTDPSARVLSNYGDSGK